jgi:CRP-like cAMP-binding protein
MPWLDDMPPADADALRGLGGERRYRAGAAIFHRGDEPGSVFVLVAGRVKFSLLGPHGTEVIVGFAGPGDLVGEIAALDGRPRSATAEAVDAVQALAFTRGAFESFVSSHPDTALLLVRHLAARLRLADEQRLEFAAYDVVGRVARRLVELVEHHGEPGEQGTVITLPLSQDELAAWTASSREAVAKALHLLRELRWVETHRRRIVVLDPQALRDYAR